MTCDIVLFIPFYGNVYKCATNLQLPLKQFNCDVMAIP